MDRLKYSIKVNNRDIVASICMNEFEYLLSKVELAQDRYMLHVLIDGMQHQLNTDIPFIFDKYCNDNICKKYNQCVTCI